MEGKKLSAEESKIRSSQSLCDGEQKYVDQRKKIVLESLHKLGADCTEDSVPHIALLGSGGGQRAAMGMLGSLCQMERDKLLDSVLYLGGISGSTWSMAFLYVDPEWSKNIDKDKAVDKLVNSEVDWEKALTWLTKKAEEEDFSLTEIWGLLTSALIMKQMDLRKLSKQANPDNPYPIYCAIEKHCFEHKQIGGTWFEGSPYEVGFPELGLFIETSLLGSKFEDGKVEETIAEMDMIKLQGILGSALASREKIIEHILHWLHIPEIVEAVHNKYLLVYHALLRLIKWAKSFLEHPKDLLHLDHLHQCLTDIDKTIQEEHPLLATKSNEDQKNIFLKWSHKLLSEVEDRAQHLKDSIVKITIAFITKHVIPLLLKWEWGTTNNFLYRYKGASVPEKLTSKENVNLWDAGLMMNVPYPSFLGDKRDIDLIIAPDFSAGEMFETLTLARDYADKMDKPFPKLDEKVLAEKNFPKDCYVFDGNGKAPTIVYLPLFNQQNCSTQKEYSEKMEKFCTFHRPYNKNLITELLNMAEENIRRNSGVLSEEIRKAAVRRQTKPKKSVLQ